MLNDTVPDERANLTAAARAAASWARARRATWTDAPLTLPVTGLEDETAPVEISAAPPAASTFLPPPPVASRNAGPSRAARAAAWARSYGAPLVVWLPRVAAAALLGGVGVVAGKYLWNAMPTPTSRARAPETTRVVPPPAKRKATGGLHVTSTPAGARVLVDGKARGVTPLTLTDLASGRHAIELRSDAGTVQRTVTVDADQTAEMDESIFSGWVAVYSPFELVVSEGGRALRLDDRGQIMLPPGRHELRLVNRALAYEAVRQVELKPGEMTTLTLTPPPSAMTVTATEAAEVWLDGMRIGETPLNAVPAQLGTHDLVVRRAAGGERRFTITISANPFTLHVDFSKPQA